MMLRLWGQYAVPLGCFDCGWVLIEMRNVTHSCVKLKGPCRYCHHPLGHLSGEDGGCHRHISLHVEWHMSLPVLTSWMLCQGVGVGLMHFWLHMLAL
jgi:hypothetical protein